MSLMKEHQAAITTILEKPHLFNENKIKFLNFKFLQRLFEEMQTWSVRTVHLCYTHISLTSSEKTSQIKLMSQTFILFS